MSDPTDAYGKIHPYPGSGIPERNTELRERLDAKTPPRWYGLATPYGWDDIIDRLDRDIEALAPGYELHQAKEKFGGLRYYIELPEGTDKTVGGQVRERILAAEVEAANTCQRCGTKPARLRGDRWVSTLCDVHGEEEGKPLVTPEEDEG